MGYPSDITKGLSQHTDTDSVLTSNRGADPLPPSLPVSVLLCLV